MTPVIRLVGRGLIGAGLLALSGWYLAWQLRGFDWASVQAALGDLSAGRIVASLCAVLLAFVAVAGQERAVVAHLALPLAPGSGAWAAMAAAAVSQTLGFGPVVGALVRRRLVRGMTVGQSFAISAGMAVGFFAGLGVMVLACLALVPGLPHAGLARAALLGAGVVVAALVLRGRVLGLRVPNLLILVRFLFWVAVDLICLALALWLVLPGQGGPDFWVLLPVFLVGLGVGVASGSPGGLGPFEATVLTYLPQIGEEALVAGIIAFRLAAYLLPLAFGALWAVFGRPGRMAAPAVTEVAATDRATLQALPLAEGHLIRQGRVGLLRGQGGWVWMTGRLGHTRVMLGDPVTDRSAADRRLADRRQVVRAAATIGVAEREMPDMARPDQGLLKRGVGERGVAERGKTNSDAAERALPLWGAPKRGVAERRLADPGPEGGLLRLSAAMAAVRRLSRGEGRVLCLYKAGPRLAVAARAAGFVVLPVAQEAVLNPQAFTTGGHERARLRRKLSHARKAGLTVSQPETLPYDAMAQVAQAWTLRHGRERGFSMGRWDAAYVAGQRVILAHTNDARPNGERPNDGRPNDGRPNDGRLVGFVSFHAGPAGWVLDLVRFGPDAPDGTIYAMLCCALDVARAEGAVRFSLAAVPVPGFGLRGVWARLAGRATRTTSGLAQFKSAFAPRWEPRYVAARGWLALGLAGVGIARAVLRPGRLARIPYAEFMLYDGAWGATGTVAASDDAGPPGPAQGQNPNDQAA